MSNIAIHAEGLGKRYRIGTAAARHDNLRDALVHLAKAPLRNLRGLRSLTSFSATESEDAVWALRDVSFEVGHGEVVGIVGRNGAGKSTLLKILSRITDPTVGHARVYGKVGSLLEVGTGFHPDLSGRENIYLNGSILGMDRAYIDRHLDEIVEFSGVERYLDTPVKRYSSGMYLRLAFAVAAHLEPDVLVVDEVLAVGDADFQKKCLRKMSEVAGQGRTVLFVSHNMGAVVKLCHRALLLQQGTLAMDGPARDVVQAYLTSDQAEGSERSWSGEESPGDRTARLRAVRVCQPSGEPVSRVDIQQPFQIEIEYDVLEPIPELNVAIFIRGERGDAVIHSSHNLEEDEEPSKRPGRHVSIAKFPAFTLNGGDYWIDVLADEPFKRVVWHVDGALPFEVEVTCPLMSRYPIGSYQGVIGPRLVRWEQHEAVPASAVEI